MRQLRIARLGSFDYSAALELQYALVAARLRDEIADTLLLLEHPHVFTLGRGAHERFLLNPPPEVEIHRVSRGGQVTYHGPGQLVGYPILKLEGSDRDVIRYLRKLEEVIIDALTVCGVESQRRNGLTGVWIGNEKIASIGVGIRRWTTMHGFAINITTDLSYFDRIVPCGVEGCRMTSIAKLGAMPQSSAEFLGFVERSFAKIFGYEKIRYIQARELWSLTNQPRGELRVHAL